MGSNAAVAYASSGYDIDGLFIMSPGHFPEGGMGSRLRSSIERARTMVAAGRVSESGWFDDLNQGKQRSLKIPAGIYTSYFDPDGLGAFTKQIRKLPKPVPLLMVIGTSDPFYPQSKSIFDSAPAHKLSRYVALNADHFDVAKIVAPELLSWLASLAAADGGRSGATSDSR
jgi:hypothetical protein